MPTISERKESIQMVLLAVEQEMDDTRTDLDSDMEDYEIEDVDNDIDMDSSGSESSLSSSSSESSSNSSSSSSSSSSESSSLSRLTDSEDEEKSDILLLQVIVETRILNPHQVAKCSQLQLVLHDFKQDDPKRFCNNPHVSPSTFDSLLDMIQGDSVFFNKSHHSQIQVSAQLAITLFRLGHDGNAASVESVAQWAGVSAGTIVNCTWRIMIVFLGLHDLAIRWPSEEEKKDAQEWVESASCPEWRFLYGWWNPSSLVWEARASRRGIFWQEK